MPLVFGNPTYAAPDKKWQEVRGVKETVHVWFFCWCSANSQKMVQCFRTSGTAYEKDFYWVVFLGIINHQPLLPILDLVDIELTITNFDYPNGCTWFGLMSYAVAFAVHMELATFSIIQPQVSAWVGRDLNLHLISTHISTWENAAFWWNIHYINAASEWIYIYTYGAIKINE